MSQTRLSTRDLVPIWVNYFFLFASFAVVVPYLQLFFAAQGFPPSQIGVLVGTFEIAGILGPLFIGHLADRTGSFRLVIVLCGIVALGAFNLLNEFPLWATALPLAFVSGFSYKSIIPLQDAQASSLMIAPELDYGRVRILGSVGFIVSSAFFQTTGLLTGRAPGATPEAAPIITAISVLLLMFLAVTYLMPARPPRHVREHHESRDADRGDQTGSARLAADHSGGSLAAAGSAEGRSFAGFDTAFWLFVAVVFIARIGIAAYYSFFSLYLEREVGPGLVSGMWAIGAAAEVPVILFSGRLIRRFGILPLLVTGFVAVVVRLLIYAFLPLAPVIAVTQLLHAATFGLLHSTAIAYINRRVPQRRRGLGMAIYSSVSLGLSIFIGSSIGGFVIEAFGFRGLFAGYAVMPALAIVVLVSRAHRLKLADNS